MKRLGSNGFSLIEMLVAVAVFAIVSAGIAGLLISSGRNFSDQRATTEIQTDRRSTSKSLVRFVREAGLDPLGTANAGIEEALDDKLRFSTDADLDGDIDAGERWTFRFDGVQGALLRIRDEGSAGQSVSVVAGSLDSVTFSYWDADDVILGTPGTDPVELARVRTVVVDMVAEGERLDGSDISRPLRIIIRCPNL